MLATLTPEDLNHLPIVLLPDGRRLVEPQHSEVAEQIGLKTRAETEFYDLVITGAGPAGQRSAPVYALLKRLKTLIASNAKLPVGRRA